MLRRSACRYCIFESRHRLWYQRLLGKAPLRLHIYRAVLVHARSSSGTTTLLLLRVLRQAEHCFRKSPDYWLSFGKMDDNTLDLHRPIPYPSTAYRLPGGFPVSPCTGTLLSDIHW